MSSYQDGLDRLMRAYFDQPPVVCVETTGECEMTEHTPGPWTVFDGGNPGDRPGIEAGRISIIVFGSSEDGDGVRGNTADEELANARLISAAPDLLAALTSIIEELPAHTNDHDWMDDGLRRAMEAARAAIAKAEGSAP